MSHGSNFTKWFMVVACCAMTLTEAICEDTVTRHPGQPEWTDFLRALPRWDSSSTAEDFNFEATFVWEKKVKGLFAHLQCVVDHSGSSNIVSSVHNMDPESIHFDDLHFAYAESLWTVTPADWRILVDRDSGPGIVELGDLSKSRIKFDLKSHFEFGIDQDNPPRVRSDPISRSVIAVKQNGGILEYSLRTPNDQEVFGHRLSEARVIVDHVDQGDQLGGLSFRGFIFDRDHQIRLHHQVDKFDDILLTDAYDKEGYPPSFHKHTSLSDIQKYRFWIATKSRPKFEDGFTEVCFQIFAYCSHSIDEGLDPRARSDRLTKSSKLLMDIFQQFRLNVLSKPQPTEKMRLPVDDPPMRWRIMEGICPPFFHILQTDLTAGIVQTLGPIDRDLVIGYLDELGRLGSPPTPYRFPLSRETLQVSLPGDELFVHAIMKTRHGLAVNEAETKATLQALAASAPGSRVERAAIDTLLRLDQLSQIPPDRFEAWWQREVVLADAFLFWDTLTMLTLQPRNREMLIQRMADSPRSLSVAIRKNLRFRAEATLRTKRFDFMPEAECHRILAVPEPQNPKTDADAGKSRPFPKD